MAKLATDVPDVRDDTRRPFQRISQLEGENRKLRSEARYQEEIGRALKERMKELNCLYGIIQLVELHGSNLEPMMQGIADLLPPSWQYPAVCCARLLIDDTEYTTPGFVESAWKQSAPIVVSRETVGIVEVYYTQQKPESHEGPFLREERALIDALAERVGKTVERIETKRRLHEALKQLQVERTALKQANAALHGVLDRIEDEKKAVQESIMANVDNVLMPVLYELETEVRPAQQRYVTVLKENLKDIVSPFVDKLAKAFNKLTAVEINICNMIRSGHTSKEIAQIRHVSPATVARQRERIRKKLGIARTDTNLATYLTSFLREYA